MKADNFSPFRIIPLIFLSFLLAILSKESAAQILNKKDRQFPNTKNGIHIFYDQPPYQLSNAQLQFIASNYTGCQKIPLDLVNEIRSFNENFIVINYRLAFGTYDNIEAYLIGNDWINDWAAVNQHDDWFITDPGSPLPKDRIKQADWDWYLMDISGEINGNTTNGWKEYWTETVIRQLSETNCDGVFADSYGFPWNLNFTPVWLQPPDDVVWIHHMEIFGNYVKNNLPENYYFIPNLGPWVTTRDVCDYGSFVDGAMIEMFGSWGPFDLFDISDWELQMNRILDLERQNKIVICQPITSDEWNVDERIFNLANYLLIKGEKTYYNLVFDENFFGKLIFLPECKIDLGPYTGVIPSDIGSLFDSSTELYVREYEKGKVMLNPSWDEVTLNLTGTFYTIDKEDLGNDPDVEIGEDGILHDGFNLIPVSDNIVIPGKGGLILLNEMPTSVEQSAGESGVEYYLYQNYPNPFNPVTRIKYCVKNDQRVILKIYDPLGRVVDEIVNEVKESGLHTVEWNASEFTSGVYFCVMTAGSEFRSVKKIILIK